MITVKDISTYHLTDPIAITIGTFDGVHVGHRKILEKIIHHAKVSEQKSAVLTFFPHPRMVLQKDTDIKLLNTIEEKTAILKQLGLDLLIVQPFTKEFSRYTAIEFVRDLLVNTLHTKKIIIGYDHRFGRNRTANIKDLIAFGSTYNFTVDEIAAQEIEDVSVSSTKIRKALEQGDISTANSYLGYHYMLTGTVIHGKSLGKKLGFPTANLSIEETYKLIPKKGVYVVSSQLNGSTVFGMMNIGCNPTVEGSTQTIEINFFNFDANLYNQKIQVKLLARLRDEKKFASVEALKTQLAKDKQKALALIGK